MPQIPLPDELPAEQWLAEVGHHTSDAMRPKTGSKILVVLVRTRYGTHFAFAVTTSDEWASARSSLDNRAKQWFLVERDDIERWTDTP